MAEVNPPPIADIKFNMLLRQENLPSNPISVHILFRLLQVYRSLGSDSYAGIELFQQDTDISDMDARICIDLLKNDGLLQSVNDDAFRLSIEGFRAAEKAENLRARSFYEPIGQQESLRKKSVPETSIWKKDISLYLLVLVAVVVAIKFLG
ncbi:MULTISPECIES: hypothetical protein [Gammaproteobacteria]|uniref:hypothetical protein n=1 Tax=Gammaproteobacteria TaxID=1236 RepID=UPI00248165D9|nr:hypothetical protein [Klebsiella pneumoniae]